MVVKYLKKYPTILSAGYVFINPAQSYDSVELEVVLNTDFEAFGLQIFDKIFDELGFQHFLVKKHLLRLLVVNMARQFKHVFWPVKMHGNARVDRGAVLVAVRKMRECVGLEYNKRTQRSVRVSVATVVKERFQYTADVCFEFLLSAFFCFVFFGIFCKNSAAQVVSTANQIIQN